MNAVPNFSATSGLRGEDCEAVDRLADVLDPTSSFLRSRWFAAGDAPATRIVTARGADGAPLAALPLRERRVGPFSVTEIAGSYWPFRGVPVAGSVSEAVLADALRAAAERIGRVWRLGPVAASDPALSTLLPAARAAGWRVLRRPLGSLFELDLAELRAHGEWPSAKTKRKNRWRLRRAEEEHGSVAIRYFTGADWAAADRDALAAIETASWLGKLPGGGDTKFRDPARRRHWESLCDDPVLARMLFGSIMTIGDTPAAFTFGVEAGDTRYYIANNYDERFTQFGAGRVLLYADFERAADHGVRRISWGIGDAGYKSEMGATAGPELLDLLFVRSALMAAVLKPLWERK